MLRYFLVSLGSGILLGVSDGLIHGNPLAQRLLSVYQPVARPAVNVVAGVGIDLAYGFLLAGIFLLLYPSLPGRSGLAKGAGFALLVWLFRVVMGAAGEWMTIPVPAAAVLYRLLTGLGQMLLVGLLQGLTLRPRRGVRDPGAAAQPSGL